MEYVVIFEKGGNNYSAYARDASSELITARA